MARCERLEKALREATPQWRFYPVVQAIQALRGVQFTVAIGLIAEIGDLFRFEHLPSHELAWRHTLRAELRRQSQTRRDHQSGQQPCPKVLVEAA